MKNHGTPAQKSRPMNAMYTKTSIRMVNDILNVSSLSLPYERCLIGPPPKRSSCRLCRLLRVPGAYLPAA